MSSSTFGRWIVRHWPIVPLLALADLLRLTSADGFGLTGCVGLVAVAAAYLLGVRWGCWWWLAALAALPAIADERMLQDQSPRASLGLLLLSVGLVGLLWGGREAVSVSTRAVAAVAAAVGAGLAAESGVVAGDPGVASIRLADPVALAFALVGLMAAAGVGRSRNVDLRLACAVLVAAGVPGALTAVVWWPVAGAVGLTALLRGRRGSATLRPQTDDVDAAAARAFEDRYGGSHLGPVAIVIAAYNEVDGLPKVLAALPDTICDLHADVVVVDDGSTDGTATALDGTDAHVVSCPVNRGQGAAMRLGYRIAREHGATYIVTTDADGQYDVADLPAVLTPILEDRADFVTGSRILGLQYTTDRVRAAGVHVFAWLATVLTGQRFTDTSFGMRAMRAEVTAEVTLNQPQYQASELLFGALSHGFRVLEVPGTMQVRSSGSTKKGPNLFYGSRYAGVMTGTWWREGCLRPVSEAAPALAVPSVGHTRPRAVEDHAAR